jgi:single-strand DNA-binding protein
MHNKPDFTHRDLKEHTHMYQKTIVIGHLGKDPEMRYTPTGVPVTSFTVATTRRWTNKNG